MNFQCDQREREESARTAARQNLIGLSFSFFGGAFHSMFGKLINNSILEYICLAWINQHLREAYPESNDEYFAGFSIIVAGDFYQLPPVSGTAIFEPRAKTTIGMAGKNAYFALSVTIRFVTLVRQSDTGASSIAFRRVLEDVREGNPDRTDFRTLQPRLLSTLERRERTTLRNRPSISLLRGRASST
ncbi:hypothetical protein E4U34_000025 [Claviceps purpurea]|nr:hypothetical protein E4U34_000025 [Claviceps purpurea]